MRAHILKPLLTQIKNPSRNKRRREVRRRTEGRKREMCLIRNVCSVIKKNVKKAVKSIS